MRIYLVRHGQSTHNANQDVPHNPDPPLTALGRQQAQKTAEALRDADFQVRALYASPQRRALETASALHDALRLPPHIHPDLCEAGGLREHAGLSRDDILGEWPGVTLDERITERGWWTGGEREDEEAVFYGRAARALSLLHTRHGQSEDAVVVVSHGRFGSALISVMLGLGPAGYSRYPLDNCAISRVDYDLHERVAYGPPPAALRDREASVAVRLRFHNEASHLPPSHRT